MKFAAGVNRTLPLPSRVAVPSTEPPTAVIVKVSPSTSESLARRLAARIVAAVSSVAATISPAAIGASLTGETLTVVVPVAVSEPSETV